MPLFRYEAQDCNGRTIVGAMQAGDEREVFGRLEAMGYNPVLAQSAPMDVSPSGSVSMPPQPAPAPQGYAPPAYAVPPPPVAQWGAPASAVSAPGWTSVSAPSAAAAEKSRLTASRRSVARTLQQLYISFRAGMPAFQAFSTVAAQVPERSLRQALHEISLGVRDGSKISDLMERYPRLFTRGDVGMIRAAELGGFLPEALENLASQHEADDNTRRRLGAWAWTLHLGMVCFLLFLPTNYFLIPAVEAGFKASVGFQAMGRAFLLITLPGLGLYVLALCLFSGFRNNPAFARRWHSILLRMPMMGKISYLRARAVFTRTLQFLVHSGLSMDDAWENAARAVPNVVLADRFAQGTSVVRGTARLSAAAQQSGVLDPLDIGMLATGESTGEVAQSLAYLANRYEEDNRVALGNSVVRGALTFTAWTFIMGGIGFVLWYANWFPPIFKAVEKAMGTGE